MTTTRKTHSEVQSASSNRRPARRIGSQFKVHPIQVAKWRKTAQDQLPELFMDGRRKASSNSEVETTALFKEIDLRWNLLANSSREPDHPLRSIEVAPLVHW